MNKDDKSLFDEIWAAAGLAADNNEKEENEVPEFLKFDPVDDRSGAEEKKTENTAEETVLFTDQQAQEDFESIFRAVKEEKNAAVAADDFDEKTSNPEKNKDNKEIPDKIKESVPDFLKIDLSSEENQEKSPVEEPDLLFTAPAQNTNAPKEEIPEPLEAEPFFEELPQKEPKPDKNKRKKTLFQKTPPADAPAAENTVVSSLSAPETPAPPVDKEKTPEEINVHEEKKKDIRFLVLYTVIFVLVISGLLAGSYLLTSRYRHERAGADEEGNASQSMLKNIQDENADLRRKNEELSAKNEELTADHSDMEKAVDAVLDMVEQEQYLIAAQNAYIDGDTDLAEQVFETIDRAALSEPARVAYDVLADKLQ